MEISKALSRVILDDSTVADLSKQRAVSFGAIFFSHKTCSHSIPLPFSSVHLVLHFMTFPYLFILKHSGCGVEYTRSPIHVLFTSEKYPSGMMEPSTYSKERVRPVGFAPTSSFFVPRRLFKSRRKQMFLD